MSISAAKDLYTLKGVKVQVLLELLSEVLKEGEKTKIAVANKAFRSTGISVRQGQTVKVISQEEELLEGMGLLPLHIY